MLRLWLSLLFLGSTGDLHVQTPPEARLAAGRPGCSVGKFLCLLFPFFLEGRAAQEERRARICPDCRDSRKGTAEKGTSWKGIYLDWNLGRGPQLWWVLPGKLQGFPSLIHTSMGRGMEQWEAAPAGIQTPSWDGSTPNPGTVVSQIWDSGTPNPGALVPQILDQWCPKTLHNSTPNPRSLAPQILGQQHPKSRGAP